MRKILLIDGNSMLFRAYYGTMTRGLMMSTSGVPTNAVYGFSTMLNKALELFKPTHILIAFDTGDKTFRHEMFENYKGTRKPVDEALVSQFALIRE
ncbi:MAG TPA: DNA polymerase I, partial [Erysipelothrix sp.]|nr:DNA polymerase I [Erysipelothrix sp.]